MKIVPANAASWADLEAILGGASCHGGRCYCQRFKLGWGALAGRCGSEHAHMLREQTDCGYPSSATTSGLVAYLDGEPAGWCNVEPRTEFPYLRSVPWRKRAEDKTDCEHLGGAVLHHARRLPAPRRQLRACRAAADFARERGARALEGYPMIPEPGKDVPWGELHVGHVSIFTAAGFDGVSRPTLPPRRDADRLLAHRPRSSTAERLAKSKGGG